MRKVLEKKERALGTNLNLKAIRSNSPKSALVRRPYPPGVHGKKNKFKNVSEYGRQLKEKQKLKFSYGISEKTLKRIFNTALKSKEDTGVKLIELLERRLDNVLFRSGLIPSRRMAKNLICHGHVLVNNKKVISPGYEIKVGDVITLKEKVKNNNLIAKILEEFNQANLISWLQVDPKNLTIKVISLPSKDNIETIFEVESIIDLFSR